MRLKHLELHKNTDKEQWPKLFFVHGFRQTQITFTARTEGFIDFQGVLSLNQNYMFENQPIRITVVLEAIESYWIISNKRGTQAFRVFFPFSFLSFEC